GAPGRQGSGLRRPRPALGHRLQPMGSGLVREAAEAAAQPESSLTAPTFWGVLMTGLPGFLREGFLPLAAFYVALKLDGLVAGIVASALVSLLIYLYERLAVRDALLVRLSLGFVAVQSIIGLAADSPPAY